MSGSDSEKKHDTNESPPQPPNEAAGDPAIQALFDAAIAGQERIRSIYHPGEAELDIDIAGAEEPTEDRPGVRGADPRLIQQRIRERLVEQEEALRQNEETIKKQKEEIAALTDRLMRMQADTENYRKRMTREREDQIKYGNEQILKALLGPLDNFELALAQGSATDVATVLKGVKMILLQLEDVMSKFGVEAISAVGEPFDPNRHEAVQRVENGAVPVGHVAAQLQKGYSLYGRLLRPARVGVAVAPPEEAVKPEKSETGESAS